MGKNVIKAKLACGMHKGKILFIPRILFHPKQKGTVRFHGTYENDGICSIEYDMFSDLLFEMER